MPAFFCAPFADADVLIEAARICRARKNGKEIEISDGGTIRRIQEG